jgi:hypothetical protein
VENPWVFGVAREDRDGVFVGYNARLRFGENGQLTLQPQVMVERAIDGTTDSYPYPWQSAGSDAEKQPATTGDDFGLLARLQTKLLGFDTNARADISTFNPDNIANGTRGLAELSRELRLPWLGSTDLRLFGAYRFRTWNGTLGEQDVYSAFGGFLERKASLPNWGRLSSNYLWRVGAGNSTPTTSPPSGAPIPSAPSTFPIPSGQARPRLPRPSRASPTPVSPWCPA